MKKEILVTPKQFYVSAPIELVADDVNAYELVFRAPCDISGGTFLISATRADGTKLSDKGAVEGKTARYVLKNSLYSLQGVLKIRATVSDGRGTVITTNEITFNVLEGNGEAEAVEDDRFPVLTELIFKVNDLKDGLETAEDRITAAVQRAENAVEVVQSAAENAVIAAGNASKATAETEEATENANSSAENASAAAQSANQATGNAIAATNKANQAATLAQKAEAKVYDALASLQSKSDCIPPEFTDTDEGKILYLRRNNAVAEMSDFTESYEYEDNVVLDAGLLDEDIAYVDIAEEVFVVNNVANPLDDRCVFGLTFITDGSSYATDYDISVTSIEEIDNGYRMLFSADVCTPFTEQDIFSASDFFAIFDEVRISGEFPLPVVSAAWGKEEEVLSPSFIDEYLITPATILSKRYTDNVVGGTDEIFVTGKEDIFRGGELKDHIIPLSEVRGEIKNIKVWLESRADGTELQEGDATEVNLFLFSAKTEVHCETFILHEDQVYEFDPINQKRIIYSKNNPLEKTETDYIVRWSNDGTIDGIVLSDAYIDAHMYIKAEITYGTDVEGRIEITRQKIGDIDHVLDSILVMQDLLIGGAIG